MGKRSHRKEKSLWPVYVAIGIPIVVGVVLLVLSVVASLQPTPYQDPTRPGGDAATDVPVNRFPDDAILRAIAQQHVRFLANYPPLARFGERDAFWKDSPSGLFIYAGEITDSLTESEPTPRQTQSFAVGLRAGVDLLDGMIDEPGSLLDKAEVIRLQVGPANRVEGEWPGGEAAWRTEVAKLQARLRQ